MNRLLLRPRAPALLGFAVLVAIALFKLPFSPAADDHFLERTGELVFDERLAGYVLSGVIRAFRQLGPDGLAQYEAFRAVDILFPWLVAALVAAVMLRLEAPRTTFWAWLAAAVDTAENAAQYAILVTRDDLSPRLVEWASRTTQVKFALFAVMGVALIVVGVRYVLGKRRELAVPP
jgi:hypothetical protein